MLKKAVQVGTILLIGVVIIFFIVPFFKPLEIQGHWIPYTYIVHGDSVELVEYCGQEAIVNIPEKIMGRPVTKIGECCFKNNDALLEVVIPDCVEKMEHSAFWGCVNLKKVELPSGLKEIAGCTFRGCALEYISLPEGLEVIGDDAFVFCQFLVQIEIPESVKEIADGAFYGCVNLQEVYIPNGVEKIGAHSFYNTPWLENQTEEFVVAGNDVLIKYNGNDENVCIPEEITFLGKRLFDEREDIKSVIVPCSVREIDFLVFADSENLECIVLENQDVILDDMFLDNCPNVTIVSTEGSTGQAYAEANGIPWMELK